VPGRKPDLRNERAARILPELGVGRIFPIIYIGAITLISQDEVHGGRKLRTFTLPVFYTWPFSPRIEIAQ
jgi:hypothetical protein